MKGLIRWAIVNKPAMNTFMVGFVLLGVISLFNLRREVFPDFELEIILVRVPYPGASPEEVEEGICQKIEEAVRSIDGIKKQTSVAAEGMGSLVLELHTGVDAQKILNEVRSDIDRIPSMPLLSEDPEVRQLTVRQPAIHVGVIGPDVAGDEAEIKLRAVAEGVRDELIRLGAVSQADIVGARDYQIDVELSEKVLRQHQLTLRKVADILRTENLELPGGTIKTQSQEILVKGDDKRLLGEEIAEIPLVTQANGVVLRVKDLGKVQDDFVDTTSYSRIDGQPSMAIAISRTASEDLLAMADAVNDYVKTKTMPAGYRLVTWGDRSVDVRDRMELLGKNGFQGLILVLIVLALFLNLRLAFWVAMGIPFSILGACVVLLFMGHTLNMLTMFAFLMALGIVVDDAIVVGENIYAHRQMGKNFFRAALDGTYEVLPSVTTSVMTTVIAFTPMFFVTGVMGKFFAILPAAMIAMLLISLVESMTILPCHLSHDHDHAVKPSIFERACRYRAGLSTPLRWTIGLFAVAIAFVLSSMLYPFLRLRDLLTWFSDHSDSAMEYVADKMYLPALRYTLANPAVILSVAFTLLLITFGLVRGGVVPFLTFPRLDSNTIEASVTFPDGTPSSVTDAATLQIEKSIKELNAKYNNELVLLTRRAVGHVTTQGAPGKSNESTGSNVGIVNVELVDTAKRSVTSQQILNEWREMAGTIAGAESTVFKSAMHGPGGTPIEFKLLANKEHFDSLEKAVEEAKDKLASYEGTFDIADDSTPGKFEYQLRIKKNARAMGVPLAEVAQTLRASYYGEEVMRLQRGRHEVKLMVRYPAEERRSLANFGEIRIRTGDGSERPIGELVDVHVGRGYSEINRVNQQRAITVSADIDENRGNARNIVADLQASFVPDLLKRHPGVSVRWEGQQEQTVESIRSLMVGFVIALLAMFVLLTLEFRSYLQPLMILAIIPFGIVGAIGGHWLMGLPLTMFSLLGLVALTGVVVNDSIVLIDFINHRINDGLKVHEALLDAGRRRLRPIILTSVTTIAGLLPLLLETSFQAQLLIPMAVSLSFGLMLTTIFVLFLVPTFYLMYGSLARIDVHGLIRDEDEEEATQALSRTPDTAVKHTDNDSRQDDSEPHDTRQNGSQKHGIQHGPQHGHQPVSPHAREAELAP